MEFEGYDNLDDFLDDISNLEERIVAEEQRWTEHLSRSRLDGPHKPDYDTHIRAPIDPEQQMEWLQRQIEAYNLRNTALVQRGVDQHDTLSLNDLFEDEDASPMSTETAHSFLSRILFVARLALHVHGRSLQSTEDLITDQFARIVIMARVVRASMQSVEGPKTPQAIVRDFLRGGYYRVLILKTVVASPGIGIRVARQRIILEYYRPASQDNTGQDHAQYFSRDDESDGGWDMMDWYWEDACDDDQEAVDGMMIDDGDTGLDEDESSGDEYGMDEIQIDEDEDMKEGRETGATMRWTQRRITDLIAARPPTRGERGE